MQAWIFIISANNTNEDLSLRIESYAIINLRVVSTKLKKYVVLTMQTYKELIYISGPITLITDTKATDSFLIAIIYEDIMMWAGGLWGVI